MGQARQQARRLQRQRTAPTQQPAVLGGLYLDLAGRIDKAVAQIGVVLTGGIERVAGGQAAVREGLPATGGRISPGDAAQPRTVGHVGLQVQGAGLRQHGLAEQLTAALQRQSAIQQQVGPPGLGQDLETLVPVVHAQAVALLLGCTARDGRCPDHVARPAVRRPAAKVGRAPVHLRTHLVHHVTPDQAIALVQLGTGQQAAGRAARQIETAGQHRLVRAVQVVPERTLVTDPPLDTAVVAAGDHIDHAGHCVRTVEGRATGLVDLDALDGLEGQAVQVGEDAGVIGQRVRCQPAPVEQHQRGLRSHVAQRSAAGTGGKGGAGTGLVAAAPAGGQPVQPVAQVLGAALLQLTPGHHLQRGDALARTGHRQAAAGDLNPAEGSCVQSGFAGQSGHTTPPGGTCKPQRHGDPTPSTGSDNQSAESAKRAAHGPPRAGRRSLRSNG